MPNTARASKYRFAIGRQTAEGTAQSTPAYELSVASGMVAPTREEEEFEAFDADDLLLGTFAQRAGAEAEVEVFSDVDAIGLIWYAHLGAIATTGSDPNYTHTIVRAPTRPFLTAYGMRPNVPGSSDRWERAVDCAVQKIKLEAKKGEPVRHTVTLTGKTYGSGVATPTPANDRRIGAANTRLLTMIGATLKLSFTSGTPVVTRAVESLVIESEYNGMEWLQTDELTGRYLQAGNYRCGVSADLVFEDFNAYTNTFFGADAGSDMALSPIVTYGSAEFQFEVSPTADANRNLKVTIPRIRLRVEPPEPDAGGDAVRYSVSGALVRPTSGEGITVVAKTGAASY